jgi:hypothetical protein
MAHMMPDTHMLMARAHGAYTHAHMRTCTNACHATTHAPCHMPRATSQIRTRTCSWHIRTRTCTRAHVHTCTRNILWHDTHAWHTHMRRHHTTSIYRKKIFQVKKQPHYYGARHAHQPTTCALTWHPHGTVHICTCHAPQIMMPHDGTRGTCHMHMNHVDDDDGTRHMHTKMAQHATRMMTRG